MGRFMGFPYPLRILSRHPTWRPRADPRSNPTRFRATRMQRWSRICAKPAPSFWARPTFTNSATGSLQRTPTSALPSIPGNQGVVAGGSSGGSAVSVAAGMCHGSVGTDTRGSIRIPAACCGVTGFKPTAGSVSMAGVIPLSPTLDHAGPIARSVEEAAILAACLCQDESLEPYSFPYEPPPSVQLGICSYYLDNIDPEIEQSVWTAIDALKQAGITVKAVDIEAIGDALQASTVITSVEALCLHDKLIEEQRGSYGAQVLERLEAGRQYSAVDLAKALATRRKIVASFA